MLLKVILTNKPEDINYNFLNIVNAISMLELYDYLGINK